MSLDPSSRSRPPRASASPARRRASAFTPRDAPTPIRPASACANGSGSARRYSTIRAKVAIVSMGFCFPGLDAKGGDLPPRRECAETWRERLFARLPNLELILLVGQYAQAWHLDATAVAGGLTETVGRWRDVYRSRRPSAPHADASSIVAEQRMAEAQSVVRSSTCCRRCGPTWRRSSASRRDEEPFRGGSSGSPGPASVAAGSVSFDHNPGAVPFDSRQRAGALHIAT